MIDGKDALPAKRLSCNGRTWTCRRIVDKSLITTCENKANEICREEEDDGRGFARIKEEEDQTLRSCLRRMTLKIVRDALVARALRENALVNDHASPLSANYTKSQCVRHSSRMDGRGPLNRRSNLPNPYWGKLAQTNSN